MTPPPKTLQVQSQPPAATDMRVARQDRGPVELAEHSVYGPVRSLLNRESIDRGWFSFGSLTTGLHWVGNVRRINVVESEPRDEAIELRFMTVGTRAKDSPNYFVSLRFAADDRSASLMEMKIVEYRAREGGIAASTSLRPDAHDLLARIALDLAWQFPAIDRTPVSEGSSIEVTARAIERKI